MINIKLNISKKILHKFVGSIIRFLVIIYFLYITNFEEDYYILKHLSLIS